MLHLIMGLVIIFLIMGVFFWMWKLSRWLVIPLQIILFILLIVVIFKVFATKENAQKLQKEIENSGIVEVEQTMVNSATSALTKKVNTEQPLTQEKHKNLPQGYNPKQPIQKPEQQQKPVPVENFVELL